MLRLTSLYVWRPRYEEVIKDIEEDRLSMTDGPILVVRHDTGKYLVMDGNHRALQHHGRYIAAIEDNYGWRYSSVVDRMIQDSVRLGV